MNTVHCLLVAILLALSVGCASRQSQPNVDTVDTTVKQEQASQSRVGGSTWSIIVPSKWENVQTPVLDPGRTLKLQAELRSKYTVSGQNMYMTVLTMKWDGDSGKFARTAAGAFIVSVGLEPVASDMGLFHGRIASIIAVAVPGGGLVFQLALSAGGIGYVLRCGGSIESGKEVARVCSEMFDLFEVKDTLPIDVTRFT